MFHHLRRSLAWGCSLGVGVGIAEALYLYSTAVETPLGGFRVVTSAVLLYLIIALVWSLPTGLVLGLVHRLRGKPDPGEGLYGALYLALGVVLVATYRVNVEFLGGFLDLSSLLVDAALLAVSWPLLTLLLRRPFRALSRSFGPAWPKLGPVYWMAVLLAAGLPQFGDDPRVGAAPPTAEAPASAPNVLFLLVDTLRADHLGCYGYPRGTSPRIDALASRGILFEDCVSQAPHTKQSTASILTSLYPPTHKMDALWASLSPEARTLPQVFHDGGWRTCLMSANS
nr:sulfatase-like hydrolase/transferase [Planctomycetota bacterium]